MPIKVGLFGFGRTGSLVAKEIVADPDLSLQWVCRGSVPPNLAYASHALGFDENFAPFVSFNNLTSEFIRKNPVDLVIDFSANSACSAYGLLSYSGCKIVSAISNYLESEIAVIKEASAHSAILASPNITLGINWMMLSSKLLKEIIPHADIEIVEEHFRAKKDVSGTALKLAKHLDLDPAKHVNSIRVGGIVGKHEAIFGLPYQTLRLTHESISRAAFGTGAIFAGKWLLDQPPGLFTMEQMFHQKFLTKIQELQF